VLLQTSNKFSFGLTKVFPAFLWLVENVSFNKGEKIVRRQTISSEGWNHLFGRMTSEQLPVSESG
jgi:hypothetical protein